MDIPIGIVGATAIACMLYCLLAVVLCAMAPVVTMDTAAPFASAFAALAPGGGAWRAAFLRTSARFVSFGAFTGEFSVHVAACAVHVRSCSAQENLDMHAIPTAAAQRLGIRV